MCACASVARIEGPKNVQHRMASSVAYWNMLGEKAARSRHVRAPALLTSRTRPIQTNRHEHSHMHTPQWTSSVRYVTRCLWQSETALSHREFSRSFTQIFLSRMKTNLVLNRIGWDSRRMHSAKCHTTHWPQIIFTSELICTWKFNFYWQILRRPSSTGNDVIFTCI